MADAKAAANDTLKGDRKIYKVMIDAPIERVWAELVDVESPRPFFFGSKCETSTGDMREGADYRMVTPDGKFVSVIGRITAFEPPHKFVQTFRFTTMDEEPAVVTYLLEDTPNGVAFSLITENVPAGSKMEKSMDQGGVFITKNLKAWCETGKPTFSGGLMLAMFKLMAPMTPKAMAEVNWPIGR